MSAKTRRRQLILDLLERQRIGSQEQFQRLLKAEGVHATQATLSRDLRDLGVMKGPAGYALPHAMPPATTGAAELEAALGSLLLSAQSAGNLIVLHTGPGRAQALALEIDRARLKGALGTVAGDDTIFIAARSSLDAGRILQHLRRLAGLQPKAGRAQ